MRYSLVVILMGSFAAAPAASAATLPPGSQVLLAEDLGNDLLMHPSIETEGAARLGSTEINNPPHPSFGMAQFPNGPDENDVRQPRTGNPTVSGQQAKANAAAVHAERKAAVEGTAVTAEEAAAQAAAAQAAGVQAARSQAMTSQAAATGAGEPSTTSLPVKPSDSPAAPSDEAAPDKQEAQPDKTSPGDAAPAEPAPAPGSDQE